MVVQTGRGSSSTHAGHAGLATDEVSLTPYARQLPRFKKAGRPHIDAENGPLRTSLMAILSHLQNNPQDILRVENFTKNGKIHRAWH